MVDKADPGPLLRGRYSRAEELTDAVIHGVAIALAVAACAAFLAPTLGKGQLARAAVFGLYGMTLVAVYASSALNQRFRGHRLQPVFQRIDRAAIFLLIAGTYTPVVLTSLPWPTGAAVFLLVWLLAGAGIALKIFGREPRERLSAALYLAMGWVGLPLAPMLLQRLGAAGLGWLVAGGLFYTIGVLFYLRERMKFSNVLWHGCAVLGSIAHFVAIMAFLF